ncbi:MAG TPA: hypothetical protein VFD03_03380, partial [Clostridia bacterium]|nr:hypothetical protein [Clostridia bacterium]
TGVGNATLYQENLVKGYLTIPKKPGVRPISIPHPLGWGGRTQFDYTPKNEHTAFLNFNSIFRFDNHFLRLMAQFFPMRRYSYLPQFSSLF